MQFSAVFYKCSLQVQFSTSACIFSDEELKTKAGSIVKRKYEEGDVTEDFYDGLGTDEKCRRMTNDNKTYPPPPG